MAKAAKRFGKKILISAFIIACLAVASYYLSDHFYQPAFIHYTKFGIDIPANYSIHGIDVSRYQKDISWPDVKEMKVKNVAIGFVFIKATEGIDMTDEEYRDNITGARQAGVPVGVYHYFIASESGKAQAESFLETVDLKKGDLPPVLDVETTSGASVADLQQRVADWLDIVEKKYKVLPIIYTNADFYKTFLGSRFDKYPFWIAHYLAKEKPRTDRSWLFWQHNVNATVSGIRARVDFNVFNGDSSDFQKVLLQ
jgi:lysozyme